MTFERLGGPTALDGSAMHALMAELFPICRSITGDGVRQSLRILGRHVPVQLHEVPSGTKCFDWEVPDEWNIRDAYVEDEAGRRVIDFQRNNLHIVSYSVPVDARMSLDELRPHLHTLPRQPAAVPYRTSYYNRSWGFCLSHDSYTALTSQRYRVRIDSTLQPGSLTYGEILVPGQSDNEILLSTNICHPSMANNELSGPVVTAALARWLLNQPKRRYSYRILFLPETIGAICYLSRHAPVMKRQMIAGYQVVCTGGPADFCYLQTRAGNTLTDRAMLHALGRSGHTYRVLDFTRRASDERQYNSPGIDLPVGSLMRSKYHDYPEYHTSLDDLAFVTAAQLDRSFALYIACLEAIEANDTYVTTVAGCEPNLGKRGLYPVLGGESHNAGDARDMKSILAYADGHHDLLDIAERHQRPIAALAATARTLSQHGLLRLAAS